MKTVLLTLAAIGFTSFTIGIVKLFANPSPAMFVTISSIGHIAYPIQAVVDINPDTLNPESEGKWITAYIELPTGHNVSEIDVSSILFNGSIPVDVEASTTIGDHDDDGVPDLTVKFNRALIIGLLSVGETKFGVTGEINGIPFEGSDAITVL